MTLSKNRTQEFADLAETLRKQQEDRQASMAHVVRWALVLFFLLLSFFLSYSFA